MPLRGRYQAPATAAEQLASTRLRLSQGRTRLQLNQHLDAGEIVLMKSEDFDTQLCARATAHASPDGGTRGAPSESLLLRFCACRCRRMPRSYTWVAGA